MGYEKFTAMPIQLYTPIFGIFAALIAPFAGFFASGMKRAYGIKDFAATLPGHGGFVDRTDCIMFMMIFTYVMLTQVIFRDDVLKSKAYFMTKDLELDDQIRILK